MTLRLKKDCGPPTWGATARSIALVDRLVSCKVLDAPRDEVRGTSRRTLGRRRRAGLYGPTLSVGSDEMGPVRKMCRAFICPLFSIISLLKPQLQGFTFSSSPLMRV